MTDPTNSNPAPTYLPPVFLNRRRVIIACTNCRKRKIRCLTAEETPEKPCGRCVKRGLKCEYITVTDQQGNSAPNKRGKAEPSSRCSSPSQAPPTTYAGFDAANGRDLQPERSYSNPNPVVGHHPYPQSANPAAGYASSSGGRYSGVSSSMEFQGYMDSGHTLPPISTFGFGAEHDFAAYGRGAPLYNPPQRAR
ncbi:hypothetical protein C8F04DRAFT_1275541 [Mycena alexandri]|uniref:Zn(2)-C6 fungal-type domain-containing protein n=1 Tax=Mycena alexandri TaxID=1745969 RepID=A0AAD6S4Z1_9AGAR|nr:hypothetical protein C8F04DRAFT_1275541 [Mycena alexandri]